MYVHFFKRLVDILCAALALLLVSPIFMLIIVLIKLDDRGPAFFVQERVGQQKKSFKLYKFRSMPVNSPNVPSDKAQVCKVTKIGELLRRTNLDELPQLLNIIKGEMSIVGPRPALSSQQDLVELRHKNGAYLVKPGLTGLAQVNAYQNMPDDIKANYDGVYAAKISLLQDIKIIFKTFTYLLKPPPVY